MPPDQWALAELDRIAGLALPATGEIERYHTLLSNTMRHYLELRFQVPASQQTTPEFLKTVSTSEFLTREQQQILGQFLEHCDLAKFARVGFSEEQCLAAVHMARTLIEQTAPAVATGKADAARRQAD